MRLDGVRILAIDDDPAAVSFLVDELRSTGATVEGETDPVVALGRLEQGGFDVAISDIEMPRLRGIDLVERLKASSPATAVILVTAFGSIDLAVEALRRGTADFITKPFRLDVLLHAVERLWRERALATEVRRLRPDAHEGVVARSPAMQHTVDLAARAAASGASVLLSGESGTGKSHLARFIHAHSQRASGPFVAVNCAALPSTLLEAELFGVRRGAFTGATEDRPGVFLEAHRGTLFLDEVGEMSLELQPKLLLALESGTVRPVGGRGPTTVDVRLIAATNRDLQEALRERAFRQDLYYRLNVIAIEVPPLRHRREDIPALVQTILTSLTASGRCRRPIRGVTSAAMELLSARTWPGNVRELANTLERGAALCAGDLIDVVDIDSPRDDAGSASLEKAAGERWTLAAVESAYARLVVDRARGNLSEAARILGVDRRTLQKKLEPDAD